MNTGSPMPNCCSLVNWTFLRGVVFCVALTLSQSQLLAQCVRTSLESPPAWSGSGAYTPDGSGVVFVDVLERKLRVYSPLEGLLLEEVGEIEGLKEEFRPTILQRFEDHLILENGDGRMLWLDSDFRMTRQIDLTAITDLSNQRVGSVWGWTPVGNDFFITFSDVKPGAGEWFSAFLLIQISASPGFEILKQMDLDNPGRMLHLSLGHRYFANTNGGAVFLATGRPTELMRWEPAEKRPHPQARNLVETAPDFANSDVPWHTFGSPADKYRYLENSRLVVGIYAEGQETFMLTREPAADGTKWSLAQIDTELRVSESRFVLPTRASSLVVASGPKTWSFLEVGPIRKIGRMSANTMITIPSSQVDKPGLHMTCRGVSLVLE